MLNGRDTAVPLSHISLCAGKFELEDVANLVNWLASDDARRTAGQLWVMERGLSAQIQQMKL